MFARLYLIICSRLPQVLPRNRGLPFDPHILLCLPAFLFPFLEVCYNMSCTTVIDCYVHPLPAAKRPGEVQTNERQPENKRPRVGNHSDSSTNAVTPKTPVMQPKQTQVSPSQAMPPPAVTTAAPPPQPSVQGPNAQYQMLMANMAGLREQIRSLSASLDNARNTGNATLTQGIQQELNKKKGMYQKFEQILAAYHQKAPAHVKAQAQALQAALQTRLQNQGASTAGPSDQKVAPSFPPDPIPSTAAPPEESRRDGQDAGQTNQNQPPNTSGPLMTTSQPRVPIPPGTTPAMASQIHQMVQQLTRPLEGLSQHPPLSQNMEMKPAGAAVQPREGQLPVWQGSLSWNGVSPAGRKEMMAFVIASTSHGAMRYALLFGCGRSRLDIFLVEQRHGQKHSLSCPAATQYQYKSFKYG